MVGFAGTGYWQSGSTVASTSEKCIMYNTKDISFLFSNPAFNASPICQVCQVEVASAISNCNNVSGTKDLWVAYPEITIEHSDNVKMINTFDTYRVCYTYSAGQSGTLYYTGYDLSSKANGKDVEFRTIVQNLNPNKEKKLKLELTTYNDSNPAIETFSSSFTVPAYATGDGDKSIKDRNSCMSLSLKTKLKDTYTNTDKIKGLLIDEETGKTIATNDDLFLAQTNFEIKTKNVDAATGEEITTAPMSKIHLPSNATYTVTHPTSIPGYKYESCDKTEVKTGYTAVGYTGTSQTITYKYKKVDQATCPHEKKTDKVVTEATCTTKGKSYKVCSDCGKEFPEEVTEIAMTGHTLTDVAAVEATCKVEGTSAHKKCTKCDYTEGKTTVAVNPDNHKNLVSHEGQAATCAEAGFSAYTQCSDCGAYTVPKTEIAKLTTHTWGEWSGGVAASCTSPGKAQSRTCSVCGATEGGEEIEATGHQHTELRNQQDASCTTGGYTGDKYCTDCNTKLESGSSVHAAGHKYENGECTVCHEKAPEQGCTHANTEDKTTKVATCTEEGSGGKWCNDCNTWVSTWVIQKIDHDLETIKGESATCTKDGYSDYKKCKVCGHEEGKQKITATGHTEVLDLTTAVASTCTEHGKDADTVCSVCKEVVKKGAERPLADHNYVDGTCTHCGKKNSDSVKPTLVDKSNGNVSLDKSEYSVGDTAKVTIKGKSSGNNLQVVKSVKVNGITIKSQSQLLDKTTWAKVNDVYKNKMGGDPTSVEFENLAVELAKGVTVDVAITESTNIEVEFEELVPVYRLYNSITSEHLFTTNKTEYDKFVSLSKTDSDAWIGEGINWFAPATGTTVHRLYNAALGAMGRSSHYYTADQTEIANLLTQGWTDDGAENQFMSGGDISIWTCYNEDLGSAHHYTSSETEWKGLAAHGWALEEDKNGTQGVFKALMSAVS